ncbi:hypothetical protein BE15_11965 [Sorangium cellulosum]|uniref:Uncharacterized protein n=1 Tax=Sorangium cellulosum TaxID=56 RepID=A0A150QG99_SORCE|nr:hypothetical protein BE15_11965 [Sorangium cellulosum]
MLPDAELVVLPDTVLLVLPEVTPALVPEPPLPSPALEDPSSPPPQPQRAIPSAPDSRMCLGKLVRPFIMGQHLTRITRSG